MPEALNPPTDPDSLLDARGRTNNRKHADRPCTECGTTFRPKGAKSRFCSRPCMWKNNGGQNKKDESWWVNSKGYIEGRVWENGRQRRVKQHRWVMEKELGRPIKPSEDVHHVNGCKTDNRPENLQVMSRSEHSRITNAENWTDDRRALASAAMKSVREASTMFEALCAIASGCNDPEAIAQAAIAKATGGA